MTTIIAGTPPHMLDRHAHFVATLRGPGQRLSAPQESNDYTELQQLRLSGLENPYVAEVAGVRDGCRASDAGQPGMLQANARSGLGACLLARQPGYRGLGGFGDGRGAFVQRPRRLR